jgi:transposase InsO family protein
MNRLEYDRGVPKRISCDNGSEFSGGQMDLWTYGHQVQMHFNRRGKPTDNTKVQLFNGKFHEECPLGTSSEKSSSKSALGLHLNAGRCTRSRMSRICGLPPSNLSL